MQSPVIQKRELGNQPGKYCTCRVTDMSLEYGGDIREKVLHPQHHLIKTADTRSNATISHQ